MEPIRTGIQIKSSANQVKIGNLRFEPRLENFKFFMLEEKHKCPERLNCLISTTVRSFLS